MFGHFRNVPRRPGDKAGMITVYLFDHGWFWMIPLPDEVMSVGVVGTRAFFKAKGSNIDALFAEAVAATPSLAAHIWPMPSRSARWPPAPTTHMI